jgi:general secretion pathway protein L
MLYDFWVWWLRQLADCLPERWRSREAATEDALVIIPAGPLSDPIESVTASARHNGRERALGEFGLAADELRNLPRLGGKPAVLRLAEADVLCKVVRWPLAAERDLAQALTLQMDRETPFTAEEVFWSHRITVRDRRRGQLSVRLLLVPRAKLARLLDALRGAGIMPKTAEIAAGPNRGCDIPLDGDQRAQAGTTGRRLLRWLAPVACIGLALATGVTPFIRQSSALAALDTEIAAGRSTLVQIDKLRHQIEHLSGSLDLVDSEREKAGRPLATLEDLTSVIPDDAYLTGLQQQKRRITFIGFSAGAGRLLGVLATARRLRNPAFMSPVTRIEKTKLEAFSISMEVAPSTPR